MSKKINSFFVLLIVFCIIFITGCNLSEIDTVDNSPVDSDITRETCYYGSTVTTAGTVNSYCYYASDLESIKSLAQQKAVTAWQSATGTSWSTAISKGYTWLVNPTFTGAGYYFVYVQAYGRPYICCGYGYRVTTAGTVNAYCYYASDMDSKRTLAMQNAVSSWESTTGTSWSTAGSKYYTWLVDPVFTGPGYYYFYVQASGLPYICD